MLVSVREDMSDDATTTDVAPVPHPHIRLAYSRPASLPPLPPRRPVNLAVAIERHLQGWDGYSDEQFAIVFARPAASAGGKGARTP
jgi:hypothetical protein